MMSPHASAASGADLADVTREPGSLAPRLERYRRMVLIRRFEERVAELYRDGEIPGFVHLSVGQEATAVGATWGLRDDDVITSTHRCHGHVLAKGLNPFRAFAELMARDAGACRGRGGSMHIAEPDLGIYGANGIVGAGLPIATGAAIAARRNGRQQVAMAFFGDGAVSTGAFHEANMTSLWRLPVILLCENNHYAELSLTERQQPVSFGARAAGYGLRYEHVDGNDIDAVTASVAALIDDVRAGGPPVFVEAETHRARGHYEGDQQRYRDSMLDDRWSGRDPLTIARTRLVELGVADTDLVALEESVDIELRDAEDRARSAPPPDDASLFDFVYAPRNHVHRDVTPQTVSTADASVGDQRTSRVIGAALEHEMETDPSVILLGIDIGAGNVFGVARSLYDRWPDRVLDTPISESAIVGSAVGAAMAGLRPVAEVMYFDFIGVCLDQLLNQAAKLRFMTGGGVELPLVIRTQFAAGRSSGSQHSQSLEALLAHIPGLTVVMPSTVADTYGLLRAAIRDPNPVVFVENRLLYERKGAMPPADHLVPIGTARVAREGRHVTLVSWSRMVFECLDAADRLAPEGVDVEVIDLRTIVPLDRQTVLDSLGKTARLVVAHEAVTDFGVGAELAALAADAGFWSLDAPVRRVGGPFTPVPYAPNLEQRWIPNADDVVAAVRETVQA